ncbi:MAG: peptidoglycan bridge formation glycyltransferase FemA/FemB family protein [bacterium]|nr:peptidoglycan bridge formation glycyltransferase FemA/FemB family protein [bacterium]
MKIIDVTDKHAWDASVTSSHPFSFFQSWSWGEFHARCGRVVYRWGCEQEGKLLGVVLAVRMQGRKGSFLHIRHGPVVHPWNKEVMSALLAHAVITGREKNVDFIRTSPLIPHEESGVEFFRHLGYRESSLHIMDAVYDWILDITPTEETLLSGMRKTTRNLIRRAQRDGVRVWSTSDSSALSTFHKLHHETMRRQSYVSYADKELDEEFKTFAEDSSALLWFAEWQGKPLAAAMVISYGDQAFYHWAGRSSEHQNIPAAYLLLWESIKEAKKRGCTIYNFWGVAPPDRPSHPWAGLTLFKQGFGGELRHYIHAQDFPLTSRYWLTWSLETFRKWQKGI